MASLVLPLPRQPLPMPARQRSFLDRVLIGLIVSHTIVPRIQLSFAFQPSARSLFWIPPRHWWYDASLLKDCQGAPSSHVPSPSPSLPRRRMPSSRLCESRRPSKSSDKLLKAEYMQALQQSYSETSRRYRRNAFTSDDWLRHRRPNRFVQYLWTTLDSGIARQLASDLILIAAASTFVLLWNALLVQGYVDFQLVQHPPFFRAGAVPLLRLPLEPFTLSSPSLGLLLVFRTNASYGRWNEGRSAWGGVVNDSRTIMRLATVWTPTTLAGNPTNQFGNNIVDMGQAAKLQRVLDCVWAFGRALQHRLLSEAEDHDAYHEDLRIQLSQYNPDLIDTLGQARHGPTRSLQELSLAIEGLNLDRMKQIELERAVTALCNHLGVCERIFTSPVPRFYTRHTARFLAGWLALLPLALYDSGFAQYWNHWGVVPACITLAFFLLGIEELAVQLEEPFSIFPLKTMVQGIRLSADEHMDWYRERCQKKGIQNE